MPDDLERGIPSPDASGIRGGSQGPRHHHRARNPRRHGLATVAGATVCRKHGGASPQVKRKAQERLLEKVPKMLRMLNELASNEDVPPAVRLAAIPDWLDGAGVDRKIEIELSSSSFEEMVMGVLSEVSEEVEIGNKLRNFASLRTGRSPRLEDICTVQKGFAMVKGFKDFLMRGNVVDLAVAVVIGAAFGAVVTAFVGGIINPLIAAIFGQPDISRVGNFVLNEAQFSVGSVLQAIVNFLLVAAAVYFAVVVPMNHLQERRKAGIEPEPKAPSEEVILLTEIRDSLRSRS
jgi:large conductance mechanosensitive channel